MSTLTWIWIAGIDVGGTFTELIALDEEACAIAGRAF